jgi:Flp pilus assembly protein TadD
MARQGSWKEAQYRFERALAVAPLDALVLNNLAVAYENNGLYSQAEQVYLQAMEHGADNEKIRANYERFRIFYSEHLASLQEQTGRGDQQEAPEEPGND